MKFTMLFRQFLRRRLCRFIIADGGAHHDDIAVGQFPGNSREHFLGSRDLEQVGSGGRTNRHRSRDQNDLVFFLERSRGDYLRVPGGTGWGVRLIAELGRLVA